MIKYSKHREITILLSLVALLLILIVSIGCRELDTWAYDEEGDLRPQAETAIETGQQVSQMIPNVGGIVSTIIGFVAPAVFGVNRALVAHRRGKAIDEVEQAERAEGRSVKDKVTTGAARKGVASVTG